MRSQGMDVVDPLPFPFGLNLSTPATFASESDLWLDRVTIRRMDSVRGSILSQSFLPAPGNFL